MNTENESQKLKIPIRDDEVPKLLKGLELIQRESKIENRNFIKLTDLAFRRAGLDADELDHLLAIGNFEEIFSCQVDGLILPKIDGSYEIISRESVIVPADINDPESKEGRLEKPEGYTHIAFEIFPERFNAFVAELKEKMKSLEKSDVAFKDDSEMISKRDSHEAKFYIKYLNTREIVLNDKYLLSKPDFMSENDVVFEFVYSNPLEKLTREMIESATKTKIKKKLYQIIDDLGFNRELKKIFFPNVSKIAIQFRNYLTDSDLREISINHKMLDGQLKALRRWKK